MPSRWSSASTSALVAGRTAKTGTCRVAAVSATVFQSSRVAESVTTTASLELRNSLLLRETAGLLGASTTCGSIAGVAKTATSDIRGTVDAAVRSAITMSAATRATARPRETTDASLPSRLPTTRVLWDPDAEYSRRRAQPT
ncbi:Uncharacterised protein [Mycobacteroides abscessus subsp. abscessus]|nr:Uncharacterised protein [Mycobacteroides abscessus subsp. abscessus]